MCTKIRCYLDKKLGLVCREVKGLVNLTIFLAADVESTIIAEDMFRWKKIIFWNGPEI